MKNIKINIEDGTFSIDNTIVAPLDKFTFLDTINKNHIPFEKINSNSITDNFSLDGKIKEYEFGVKLFFKDESIEILWLAWDGGNSKKFGYNTTEDQLISDKNHLTKLLNEIFNKKPDCKKRTNDTFNFHWGHISTSASIQSSTVSIGIFWKNNS